MAVPSSGAITMTGIYNEIDVDDYSGVNSLPSDLSLKGLEYGTYGTINTQSASYPSGSAPYAMTEFYSYDHDYSSWNNNTDWYSTNVNAFWNTYEKFRIDFGYNSSYNGSGTSVNDVEGWGSDCDIISSAVHTASTSATTPGYITADGSADCVHSWDEGALQNPMSLHGGGGTTIMIWFSLAKMALKTGAEVYKNKQEAKQLESVAAKNHMAKMAAVEISYQQSVRASNDQGIKDDIVLLIVILPIVF